jgi:hypothetical protein
VLLAELLLGVTQMRLCLVRHQRACGSDLSLDGGDRLAGDLADGVGNAGHARHVRHGGDLGPELLDARGHPALVIARLREVLAEALLVRHLLCERDVRGQIGLELRLLGVRLVQPLDQLGIASVQSLVRQGIVPF